MVLVLIRSLFNTSLRVSFGQRKTEVWIIIRILLSIWEYQEDHQKPRSQLLQTVKLSPRNIRWQIMGDSMLPLSSNQWTVNSIIICILCNSQIMNIQFHNECRESLATKRHTQLIFHIPSNFQMNSDLRTLENVEKHSLSPLRRGWKGPWKWGKSGKILLRGNCSFPRSSCAPCWFSDTVILPHFISLYITGASWEYSGLTWLSDSSAQEYRGREVTHS